MHAASAKINVPGLTLFDLIHYLLAAWSTLPVHSEAVHIDETSWLTPKSCHGNFVLFGKQRIMREDCGTFRETGKINKKSQRTVPYGTIQLHYIMMWQTTQKNSVENLGGQAMEMQSAIDPKVTIWHPQDTTTYTSGSAYRVATRAFDYEQQLYVNQSYRSYNSVYSFDLCMVWYCTYNRGILLCIFSV